MFDLNSFVWDVYSKIKIILNRGTEGSLRRNVFSICGTHFSVWNQNFTTACRILTALCCCPKVPRKGSAEWQSAFSKCKNPCLAVCQIDRAVRANPTLLKNGVSALHKTIGSWWATREDLLHSVSSRCGQEICYLESRGVSLWSRFWRIQV